jgi:hypothetical protein
MPPVNMMKYIVPLNMQSNNIVNETKEIGKIENKNSNRPFFNGYLYQKIFHFNEKVEYAPKDNSDLFLKHIYDWILCEEKFPTELISTYILFLSDNGKLNEDVTERWEIIDKFMNNCPESALAEINTLLDKHKDKKDWFYYDLLIDKRTIENALNEKEKNPLTHVESMQELQNINNIYYPIVDRQYERIYEILTNKRIKSDLRSLRTIVITDSIIEEIMEIFSNIVKEILQNGSLTHIIVTRKRLAAILFELSKYFNNDEILYSAYLRNTLITANVQDFKKAIQTKNVKFDYNVFWNQIEKSSIHYHIKDIEITFSKCLYSSIDDSALKKTIKNKMLSYYNDAILKKHYYTQKQIFDFVTANIKTSNMDIFLENIANTLDNFYNKKVQNDPEILLENIKVNNKNLHTVIKLFEYACNKKINNIYVYLNLRKKLKEKIESYDEKVLSVLDENSKIFYLYETKKIEPTALTDYILKRIKLKMDRYKHSSNNNSNDDTRKDDDNDNDVKNTSKDIESNVNNNNDSDSNDIDNDDYYIGNLIYVIDKVNTDDKIKIFNEYCNLLKLKLIDENANISNKFILIDGLMVLAKFEELDATDIFNWISESKEKILISEKDFFDLNYLQTEKVKLYISLIETILGKIDGNEFLSTIVYKYNQDDEYKITILCLLYHSCNLCKHLDLKTILPIFFNDINNVELQDKILLLCTNIYNSNLDFIENFLHNFDLKLTEKSKEVIKN